MNYITILWKRQSKEESIPNFTAWRKEGEMKTFSGIKIPGGLKFVIPDIEENQELTSTLSGKWSVRSEKKPAPEKNPAPEKKPNKE